jgi:hypothetical protein
MSAPTVTVFQRERRFGWRLFLGTLRHKTRMRVCPAYTAGLIGPGDRKSLHPMAAGTGEVVYDQLHHFFAYGPCDRAPLKAVLLESSLIGASWVKLLPRLRDRSHGSLASLRGRRVAAA